LRSNFSTFLSPAPLLEKRHIHSYCRCGKELNLENVEGDLVRWKGLKNKNKRMTQGAHPALTATGPRLLLPSSRAPEVSL